MKKYLSIVLVLAMFCALIAGCGVVQKQPDATPEPAAAGEEPAEPAAAAASSILASSAPLEGASVVLKVAHPDNDTSLLEQSWNCYARTFKNFVELYSGGEITCELYPNNQLGDASSCMEQCSQGTVDVVLSLSTGSLAGWIPNISVFDVPYIIGNLDVCNLVCQGDLYRTLDAELKEAGNLHIMSMFQTGFRNIDTMEKQITCVEDLKGLVFRLQEVDAQIAMANAWGAVPTTVSFSELYSAAQTGMIGGFDNSNHILFLNNLYETVKYVTETEHLANVVVALMSDKTYEGLTADQQQAVDRAAAEARRATLGVVAANNINTYAKLESYGIEILALTAEEKQAFKDACYESCLEAVLKSIDQNFYDQFVAEYDKAASILGIAG